MVDFNNGSEIDLKNKQISNTPFRPSRSPENINKKRYALFKSRRDIIYTSYNTDAEYEEEDVVEEIRDLQKTESSPVLLKKASVKEPVLNRQPSDKKENLVRTNSTSYLANLISPNIDTTQEVADVNQEVTAQNNVISDIKEKSAPQTQLIVETLFSRPIFNEPRPILTEFAKSDILPPEIQIIHQTVLPIKHKRTWKFPETSEEILSLCANKGDKDKVKAEITAFRKYKKVKQNLKEKQTILAKLLLRFVHWKRYIKMKKFKIYVINRMEEEKERFYSQFSKVVIDDTQANLRYKELKRRKIEASQLVI